MPELGGSFNVIARQLGCNIKGGDNGNATDVTITETSPEYTDFGGYSQGGWADKSSIMIDGESHGGTDNSYEGSWHIQVRDGETMTCNFSV